MRAERGANGFLLFAQQGGCGSFGPNRAWEAEDRFFDLATVFTLML